jgi:hypothetical protein
MLSILVAFIIGVGIGLIVMLMTRGKNVKSVKPPSNILGIKYTRGQSAFMDAIDNIENKIMPIAQGAMCNILHDPALMEMIPDEGGVKCQQLIARIEREIETFSDIIDGIDKADRSDVEEVQFILYTELLALIEVLTTNFCSDGETMIDAATVKSIINDIRESVCEGFDIDPITFKEYSENVMKDGLATGKIFTKLKTIKAISTKK